MISPSNTSIQMAIKAANNSPCKKSARGVAAYYEHDPNQIMSACNGPPASVPCPGKAICGEKCRQLAIHAESRALYRLLTNRLAYQGIPVLVHVKVLNGNLVPSGPPSCLPCAALINEFNGNLWLFHEDGWKMYSGSELYSRTLEYHCLDSKDYQ